MSFRRFISFALIGTLAADCMGQTQHQTKLFWGDTHLHTSNSFDAYMNGNYTADPDTSYRWAKGEPVIHPYSQTRVKINTPLDFLVVSDHSEFLGFVRGVVTGDAELEDMGLIGNLKRWIALQTVIHAINNDEGAAAYQKIMPKAPLHEDGHPILDPHNPHGADPIFGDPMPTVKTAWSQMMDSADKHYAPGKFTTLVGWEWTSTPTGTNLHRVVISSSSGHKAKQYIPFGSDQSQYPEDLWNWLAKTEKDLGVEFIAIPHNSNVSKGFMFPEITLNDKPISPDYARLRMRFEPVIEVTQIKGDSETHPQLSPEDEFSDFETYQFYLQSNKSPFTKIHENDYARGALKRGLAIEQSVGVNPYKFGMIGSTDSHTGLSSAEETNFWGKMAFDSVPKNKSQDGKGGIPGSTGWDMAASGLAAVWARENTREEIFAAFKRKEVYATSGPRIAVRFFGGWNFGELADDGSNIATLGYAKGTPMGGELSVPGNTNQQPEFLIQAVRDPLGTNLDRIQVVKGWVDPQGTTHERVYNVAWSEQGKTARSLDSKGKLTPIGDTVDRKTGDSDNSIGSPQLITKWQDLDFNPDHPAFYYVRVLQIPTARHSLLDTLALEVPHPADLPEVIQERAYTSPIWFTPR